MRAGSLGDMQWWQLEEVELEIPPEGWAVVVQTELLLGGWISFHFLELNT